MTRLALVALALGSTAACGGGARAHLNASGRARARSLGEGRPQLAFIARGGDARSGLAVAVSTEGVAPDRGAVAAVALGALVEARLAARPRSVPNDPPQVVAAFGWSGFRLRALVAGSEAAATLVEGIRHALLTPVTPDEPALDAVRRKVEALSRRPLPDRAMAFVTRCTGEAYGLGGDTAPTASELEAWRQAADVSARVAFAAVGDEALAQAVTEALARGPVWPVGAPPAPEPWPPRDAPAVTYDASSEIPPGAARVVIVARTSDPEHAIGPAAALGDVRGPLASRLAALSAPARIRTVVATAHPDGGCLAVTIDLAPGDLERDAPGRIATAAALARQEITVELADAAGGQAITGARPEASEEREGGDVVQRAADPRDAAEQAAFWALSGRHGDAGDPPQVSTVIGLSASRDGGTASATRTSELRSELDRATIAWHVPVVEGRVRVEQGQGETWVLIASPCGTSGEAADAGSGAAVVTAAAFAASASMRDVKVEPFIAADGIGVLAHGPARPGESAQAQGRRLADLAARAFAADTLGRDSRSRARTVLLVRTAETAARVLGTAGSALTSGHPSWIVPIGTALGVSSISDDDIEQRAAALRAGPLRVAVLASGDSAQGDAAVRAVDRWIARRPGELRSCPVPASTRSRAGTYAVALPAGARSEALLALPLPASDEGARTSAEWLEAALEGEGGLLSRALGGPAAPGAAEGAHALASSWSVQVVGGPQSSALAVRLVSDDASLDAAVAQTRALLDRLRQGALRDEDRARAAQVIEKADLAASLDPGLRTVTLWRNGPQSVGISATPAPPPTLEALRSFAAAVLRDDALVVVAARPPRERAEPANTPAHDSRTRAH